MTRNKALSLGAGALLLSLLGCGDATEVLKDGTRILIRLKGLAFPSGNSLITEANFPLLGKVQQAVLDLGSGPVERLLCPTGDDDVGAGIRQRKRH